jgi:hypothetical protein
MPSTDEIAEGICILKQYVDRAGLSLEERRLRDLWSYYFEVTGHDERFDFVVSNEFLMDLPSTPGHQLHVNEYLPAILTRFRNHSPSEFFAKSGTAFRVTINWPFKAHPSRDVIWCHVEVEDLRFPGLVAMTTPAIWTGLDGAEFRFRPFARIEAVVNAIRGSLDRSEIQFYKRDDHPSLTQEISIFEELNFARSPDESVEQFLAGKVFWLAFKRGNQSTPVWIADPWDAKYLGVSVKELIQTAQVLQARGLISLAPDNQFASARDALLLSLPVATATRVPIGFQVPSQ